VYISLRESRRNGYKQWSDSHQPTIVRLWDAEEGVGIVAPGSAIASPDMTVALSLLAAEESL
jgi:hypothetical protein